MIVTLNSLGKCLWVHVNPRGSADGLGEWLRRAVRRGPLTHRMGQSVGRLLPVQAGDSGPCWVAGDRRRISHFSKSLRLKGQHQAIRCLPLRLPFLCCLPPETNMGNGDERVSLVVFEDLQNTSQPQKRLEELFQCS